MSITQIAFVGVGSILYRLVGKNWQREKIIFLLNIFILFLIQPGGSIRYLNFILPWIMIFILMGSGFAVAKTDKKEIFLLCMLCLLGFLPFLFSEIIPALKSSFLDIHLNVQILLKLLGYGGILLGISYLLRSNKAFLPFVLVIVLLIFVFLKQPALTTLTSGVLRGMFQQNISLASALDIRWIGYSYITFRLIHVIREYQKGRIRDISLIRFMNYCLFFPAVTAGPINRYDDFSKQIDNPELSIQDGFLEGGKRLFMGLFKKFVIADSIAILALNSTNAGQINQTGWMWVTLIFYSFQIYFDFSGYTDIAIGLGYFWGIKLPENFDKPYLKSNLTKFWDSWHITLSQWIRAYYFNPVNRSLRKTKIGRSPVSLLFFLQVTTMLLIGLWHGFTWTFAIWGLWHGIGLFVQNRWSTWLKKYNHEGKQSHFAHTLGTILSTLLTFTYVSLGWVWFLSPTVSQAVRIFQKLLGLG